MAAQIRPNRLEVSDRFPMLGFTIRTDGSPQRAEVAVATDPSLFRPDKKAARTGANFYSSRAAGPLVVPRGEAIYVLPPEILARFIGQERLYFGLATTPERNGNTPQVAVLPSEGSPYISLRGLTGRSLKRVRVMPSRQERAAGYGANGKDPLEWAGDAATPGQEPATVPAVSAPGAPATAGGNGHGAVRAYDDGFGPLAPPPPPVPASAPAPAPVALAHGSFSINWDGLEPINQPTAYSCWATAAAMVLGWHDDASMDPASVATYAGRSTLSGLDPNQVGQFASEIGLTAAPPESYTIDGFRHLPESRGPLWVGVKLPGSAHAVVVTGLYSDGAPDGSDTFVCITDPWDRVPGTPGAPGPYLGTHDRGSRYILAWSDFVREYEGVASTAPTGTVNALILYAGITGNRTPNRNVAPAGYAMAAGRAHVRPLANESFSINWDDLKLIYQPTGQSCWAAAAAMVLSWRSRASLTPDYVAECAGRTTVTGLSVNDVQLFATQIGLEYQPPQSYSIDALRNLLEAYGPLWVGVQLPGSGHAVVVVGLYSDGAPDGSDTFVRIADPWDRHPGTPGAPGPYLGTHNTGSRYILTWDDFVREYEGLASVSPAGTVNAQILHAGAGSTSGRTPNRQTGTPPGYAMAASRGPSPQAAQGTRGTAGSAEQVIARAGEISSEMEELATRLLSQGVPSENLLAFLGPPAPPASVASAVLALPQTQGVVRALETRHHPARLPAARTASRWEELLLLAALSALSPALAVMVATARTAANQFNVSIGLGPTANVGLLIGGGVGAGIVFAPGNEIGFYGQFDLRSGLIDSASVEMQCTIVSGSIGSFSGISWALGVEVDLGISLSAQALFDAALHYQGVTFGLGVGLGIEPVQVFLALQGTYTQAMTVAHAQAAPTLPTRPLPPQVQTRRALALDTTGAIVPPLFPGGVIERVDGSSGNIRWQLDQLRGFKRPAGVAPGTVSCIAPVVRLIDWPYVEGRDGTASLPLTVDWEFDTSGAGNIRIAAGEARNADGVTLDVRALILDEPLPPATNGPAVAVLKVRIEYRFTTPDGPAPLAVTDLLLYGDGKFARNSEWQTALVH